jgi:ketosteroid isomerase-like protein
MTRTELESLTLRFTEAFNRDDLDGVLTFIAEDAIYDEFNGTRNRGKAAIRAAFVPQFRGDYGRIRFDAEDVMVDPEARKTLIRWRCILERDGETREWRGLDVLHFEGGLVTEKHTYAKAEVPRLVTLPDTSRRA